MNQRANLHGCVATLIYLMSWGGIRHSFIQKSDFGEEDEFKMGEDGRNQLKCYNDFLNNVTY